jgi:hypothetical protein
MLPVKMEGLQADRPRAQMEELTAAEIAALGEIELPAREALTGSLLVNAAVWLHAHGRVSPTGSSVRHRATGWREVMSNVSPGFGRRSR